MNRSVYDTRAAVEVIPTRRRAAWPWVLGALLAVLALLAATRYSAHLAAASQLLAQAEHDQELISAFEAGRVVGQDEMLAKARSAWQTAMADADQRCTWRRP